MRKEALTLLLFIFAVSLNAQTITKSKIQGKWKANAVEMNGKKISVADEASILKGLAPETGTMSKEELDLFKTMADLLYGTIGNMSFEFRSNDTMYATIKMTIKGQTQTETEATPYLVMNNKLNMDMGDGKEELVELSMPDPQTLVFNNFNGAGGRNIIFKKQ